MLIYDEPTGELTKYNTDEQQVILAAEYICYVLSIPVSVGAISEHTTLDTLLIQAVLSRQHIQSALIARGIATNSEETPQRQMAFILALFNPLDMRNHKQIMADLGITLAEYYGWQRSQSFKELQNRLAADFFGSAGLFVDRELIRRAIAGSAPHMRLYYEQRQDQALNPRVVIQRLVDVVQNHVHDPELQRKIAQDLIKSTKTVKGSLDA